MQKIRKSCSTLIGSSKSCLFVRLFLLQIQNLQPPPGGRRGGGVCGVVVRGMGVANFTFDGFDGDLTDLTEPGARTGSWI